MHSSAAAATLARLFVSGTVAGRQLSCPSARIFNYESQLDSELYVIDRIPRPRIASQGGKMILETPRLILRPFAADDLDRMAELMANKDFMRFSTGPMTQEQTKSFLDKVIGWDRDGMPSQFAMIVRFERNACGLLRLFSPRSRWQNGN